MSAASQDPSGSTDLMRGEFRTVGGRVSDIAMRSEMAYLSSSSFLRSMGMESEDAKSVAIALTAFEVAYV